MNIRQPLEAARKLSGVSWEIIERDFALSWVLIGLSQVESLQRSLIFKGGSCLKKCYFGAYRFSEDLDFTAGPSALHGQDLESALISACERIVDAFRPWGPMAYKLKRHEEKKPHPRGQECFEIRLQMPWHRPGSGQTWAKVKLEISSEVMLWPAQQRALLSSYEEPTSTLTTYSLEEIISEKLRGLLQSQATREQRGWARSRLRDYYDLWRILQKFRSQLDLVDFRSRVMEKCQAKDVHPDGPESFFPEALLEDARQQWVERLQPFVDRVPEVDQVILELRSSLKEIW